MLLAVTGLEVEVTRKRIKNLYLRVSPEGRVRVSAPLRVSDAAIRRFVESRREWIDRQLDSPRPRRAVPPVPTADQWAEFAAALPVLVERWQGRFEVEVPALRFRQMRSRWGSCNVRTRAVTLNRALAAFPPPTWEYVLVHELCHYFVAHHGPDFRALMDRHLPDWRERRALLACYDQ